MIGDIYKKQVVERVNNRLISAEGLYGFIDTNDVDRFLDEVAQYDGNTANISQQFKDYCDIYEDDFLIKKAFDEKLAKYGNDARERAKIVPYDTIEQSLKSVAGIENCSLNTTNAMYLMNYGAEGITTLGTDLMAGLKDKALEFAEGLAKLKSYNYREPTATTKSRLDIFINGSKDDAVREGSLYGSDSNLRAFGRIFMAIGIRTAMGDGFFQQPSSNGHSQLAAKILDAYSGRTIYRAEAKPTCDKPGNKEFWLVISTGKYYSNEECTQEISADSIFTAPLGHDYKPVESTAKDPTCTEAGKEADQECSVCHDKVEGEEIAALGHDYHVTKKTPAEVGKDGKIVSTCSRCGDVVTEKIPAKNPAKTSIKKVSALKKGFKVTWKLPSKANLKKTTGYQIKYSLKSSMASPKTVTVKKNKTTSKAIKKLKAKKKYYVQIRTYYKNSSGKMYYSGWSTKKSVKTK
jgi:hypothetical protein